MQPINEQRHIVLFSGSESNGFNAVAFESIDHETYKRSIARFRLPPPKFWAVIHTDAEALGSPSSRISLDLLTYMKQPGTGVTEYMRAAIENCLPTQEAVDSLRRLYSIAENETPGAIWAFNDSLSNTALWESLEKLEAVDALNIITDSISHISKSRNMGVTTSAKGRLLFEAVNLYYA